MFVVKKSHHNPLLSPNKESLWESVATFNACPIHENKGGGGGGSGNGSGLKKPKMICVYRAMGRAENIVAHAGPEHLSTVGVAESEDGIVFTDRRQLVRPEADWEKYGCEDPRVTFFEGNYYIFYTALSNFPFNAQGIKVAVAVTKDFKTIHERHLVTPFNAKAMTLFPERVGGKIAVILSVNTDMPPAKIAFAFVDRIEQLWDEAFWKNWYENLAEHTIDVRRFPTDHIEVGAPPIKTADGWLFIYSHIQHYFEGQKIFGVEALLLDLDHPDVIIGRTKGPLIVPEEIYEQYGLVPGITFPSGAILEDIGKNETAIKNPENSQKTLAIYYGAADTTSARATVDLDDLLASMIPSKGDKDVTRFEGNPILSPIAGHPWEARAVFNPAAIDLDGKIHILYRAMSDDNTSTVGYASSRDGLHIDERLSNPIYVPREAFESKRIPGGNSGCEDPRIVKIDNVIYMTYTGYDGIRLPGVAITSIGINNFLAKKWNWTKPVIISPIEVDDKDSALLSEKINGKYMILHRVGLNICADFVKTLDFTKEKIIRCIEVMKPRPGMWDGRKIGIGAPPIKTKKGWLLIYHGISERGFYRVGAALLDLKDPTKVVSRMTDALMGPEMKYEIDGQIQNVVFPCGIVIRKDTLFIYYGGADSVTGVATVKLSKLLKVMS
jgi:predicted GH43/DUF377 family glycosyl hydrolase